MSLTEIAIGIGSSILGWVIRHYFGDSTWNEVQSTAKQIVASSGTSPEDAVKEALIKTNLDRLAAEAQKVQDAFRGL